MVVLVRIASRICCCQRGLSSAAGASSAGAAAPASAGTAATHAQCRSLAWRCEPQRSEPAHSVSAILPNFLGQRRSCRFLASEHPTAVSVPVAYDSFLQGSFLLPPAQLPKHHFSDRPIPVMGYNRKDGFMDLMFPDFTYFGHEYSQVVGASLFSHAPSLHHDYERGQGISLCFRCAGCKAVEPERRR